jgi:hypothetical protein
MILANVIDDLETRLKTIPGLRVYPWGTQKITPPGCVLTMPERITVRSVAGRGSRIEGLAVVVAVGRTTSRTAPRLLSPFVSTEGTQSIKYVLESGTYTAFDVVEVDTIEINELSLAGVDYLGAMINTNIVGKD